MHQNKLDSMATGEIVMEVEAEMTTPLVDIQATSGLLVTTSWQRNIEKGYSFLAADILHTIDWGRW